MKKIIIFLLAFITVISVFSGCKKNENNEVTNSDKENVQQVEIEQEKPLNQTYQTSSAVEAIQEKLGENSRVLSEDEINEKYKNEELKNLEKQTIILSSEDNYEEVTVVKLSNTNQYFEIQKAMNDRVEMLKKEFENNDKVLNMLEKPENLKIKIQDNIAIFVVSTNANDIIGVFDSGF